MKSRLLESEGHPTRACEKIDPDGTATGMGIGLHGVLMNTFSLAVKASESECCARIGNARITARRIPPATNARADGIWELIKVKAHGAGSGAIHTRRSADPVVLSLRSLLKTSS